MLQNFDAHVLLVTVDVSSCVVHLGICATCCVQYLFSAYRAIAHGPASQAMAGPVFFEEFLIFISTARSMGVVNFI